MSRKKIWQSTQEFSTNGTHSISSNAWMKFINKMLKTAHSENSSAYEKKKEKPKKWNICCFRFKHCTKYKTEDVIAFARELRAIKCLLNLWFGAFDVIWFRHGAAALLPLHLQWTCETDREKYAKMNEWMKMTTKL